MIAGSFLFFLAIFTIIGIWSMRRAQGTTQDYLLAGHQVRPWIVALSAVATNNSGFMFIGLIGMSYHMGLSAIWLMIGWILGDFLASLFVHRRLREVTEARDVYSYGGALAKWEKGQDFVKLRAVVGLMTLFFLGTYAAAQLNAGSKALYVLFGWPYEVGAVIGTAIVIAYCFSGGLRASLWTDVAQSFVMAGAMVIMLILALTEVGGLSGLWQGLNEVDPALTNVFQSDLAFGPAPFVLSWVGAGIAVIGQPHIMIRFMSLSDPKLIRRTRVYYYSWYVVFSVMAYFVGFAARLLIPEVGEFDAELALPQLAKDLLPDVFVGLVLAGLFAATMSTADSQVLSTSAAITRDLFKPYRYAYWFTKATTLLVALIALMIAISGPESVFKLVVVAWSALGAAFSPLLIVYVLGGMPKERVTIAMVVAGLVTVYGWRWLGYSSDVYEVLPGMIAGFAIYGLSILPGWHKASPPKPAQDDREAAPEVSHD